MQNHTNRSRQPSNIRKTMQTARDIPQQVVQLLGTMQTARDIPQQVVQLLGFLLKTERIYGCVYVYIRVYTHWRQTHVNSDKNCLQSIGSSLGSRK